jgi:hypothetical protein
VGLMPTVLTAIRAAQQAPHSLQSAAGEALMLLCVACCWYTSCSYVTLSLATTCTLQRNALVV